jgi:hypothetical protein
MRGTTRVRLQVRNGYQKTPRLFRANARARGVTIVLLPSGITTEVDLADRYGWQEVVAVQPAGPLDAVELRFRSVYPGAKYDDLCLSDVRLHVTATSPENPAFEKARLDKIIAWKAGRIAAARQFKAGRGKGLPVASQYLVVEDETPVPRIEGTPCERSDDRCWIALGLDRARRDAGSAAHVAAIERASAWAREQFRSFAPVQVTTAAGSRRSAGWRASQLRRAQVRVRSRPFTW